MPVSPSSQGDVTLAEHRTTSVAAGAGMPSTVRRTASNVAGTSCVVNAAATRIVAGSMDSFARKARNGAYASHARPSSGSLVGRAEARTASKSGSRAIASPSPSTTPLVITTA